MKRIVFLLIILTIATSCMIPVSGRMKDEIDKFKDPMVIGTATKSDVISDFGYPRYKSKNSFLYVNEPL